MLLRDYQQAAVDSIFEYFTAGNRGNPLVVAPTGSGKSVIQAEFVKTIYKHWPNQRVMLITHVKELLEQNYSKLKILWPDAPVGLYSAGLKRRETMFPITVAGIQSVYKKKVFGWIDLIIIDEAQLLGPDETGMYRTFIAQALYFNKHLKVIGLTATPFRTKGGMLTFGEERLFTDICYSIDINYLIKEGHLAPIRSRHTDTRPDLTGVRIENGEFKQNDLQKVMDRAELTKAALDETFSLAANRKSWLVFCSGVDHALHVCEELNERGMRCECIHGKTPDWERDRIIEDFKAGRLPAITSMGVLTTGFDAPIIDLIILLRPTRSPGLYIQMLGRGMRISPDTGKTDCLLLDYGGNIDRFGPINCIDIKNPRVKDEKDIKTKVVKICPQCNCDVSAAAKICPECNYEFPIELMPIVETVAASGVVVADTHDGIQTVEVERCEYERNRGKNGKRDTMVVTYHCGKRHFKEFICIEHSGFPRGKAVVWWSERASTDYGVPLTIADAISHAHTLLVPKTLKIQKNLGDTYHKIVGYLDFQTPNPYKIYAGDIGPVTNTAHPSSLNSIGPSPSPEPMLPF